MIYASLFTGIGGLRSRELVGYTVVMKQFSKETRRKMSESAKRRCQTPEWKANMGARWEPFCTAEELREDYVGHGMSQIEVAEKYAVSLRRVQIAMRRFGIQPRKAIKRNQRGERNASWKGAQATYKAFHIRLRTLRGRPKKCEVCGTTDADRSYDWANLTGRYDDPDDYQRMCRSCHRKYDGQRRNPVNGGDAHV